VTRDESARRRRCRIRARARFLCAWAALVSTGVAGCATYAERTAHGRASVAEGAYDDAVGSFNRALGVDARDEMPRRLRSETALILLERAMVSQAQGYYDASARDLEEADERLEILDISNDAAGTVGKYFYSDSSTKYHTSPVEKLALNSMNMLNYLAIGDLASARVEAKRFTVMRDYLTEHQPDVVSGTAGAYLAGFVFERLGEPDAAIRYYDEALRAQTSATLAQPLTRLARITTYRGENVEGVVAEQSSAEARSKPPPGPLPAEILTVVSLGRVPIKRPERMPIGAAIGLAGTYVTGDLDVLGYTATKVLVYPELEPTPPVFTTAAVSIDGEAAAVDLAGDFGAEITAEYEKLKPKILGAALSRMIVRAAAAEGARAAGQQAGDAGEVLGWVAALATEATLVAFDKPDTRSWTLLPERVFVSRRTVAPGSHVVDVDLTGYASERRSFDVDVPPGGFAAVVITPLR
jgi:tetratricopeptide (TPR) repeat protein